MPMKSYTISQTSQMEKSRPAQNNWTYDKGDRKENYVNSIMQKSSDWWIDFGRNVHAIEERDANEHENDDENEHENISKTMADVVSEVTQLHYKTAIVVSNAIYKNRHVKLWENFMIQTATKTGCKDKTTQ